MADSAIEYAYDEAKGLYKLMGAFRELISSHIMTKENG